MLVWSPELCWPGNSLLAAKMRGERVATFVLEHEHDNDDDLWSAAEKESSLTTGNLYTTCSAADLVRFTREHRLRNTSRRVQRPEVPT